MTNQIDERVAREVIGLIPCDAWKETNFGSAGGPAWQKACEHDNCYPAKTLGSIAGPVGGVPPYSTNIAHAWQVVERLSELPQFSTVMLYKRDGLWDCELFNQTGGIEGPSHTSAPMAICLAALKAVGVEEK